MVKVPRIGGPGPTAHFDPRLDGHIPEPGASQISIQRIAEHMPLIKCTSLIRLFAMKVRLTKNTQPRSHPHAGGVDILMAVVVVI
jgi:hypothetical protein